MPSHTLDRLVPLQAVHNFRDMGGYKAADGRTTKWRNLFRADGLQRLTPDDIEVLRPLGLRTVIDLRTEAELSDYGTFPVDDHPLLFSHQPLMTKTWGDGQVEKARRDTVGFLVEKYLEMLDDGRPAVRGTFELLADPASYPAVFHCAAGKDRTGVIAMLILSVVGVPDDMIAHDYALTGERMERALAWFRENPSPKRNFMENPPDAYVTAPVAVMPALLTKVRSRHGSVAGYLRDVGVDDATMNAAQELLVA